MRHRYECPTRWADLDLLGHVNNVAYVDFLQQARVDFVRRLLPDRAGSYDGGISTPGEGLVVVRHEVTYLASLGERSDPVSVECWVTRVRAATFTLGYEVFHDDSTLEGGRRVYVRARSVLAPYVFASQRPRRISPGEREALARFLEEDGVPGAAPIPAVDRDGAGHWPLSVRFSDLDVYGHVNNVRNLEYFQEARIRLMRELIGAADLRLPSIVVAQADVDYRRPLLMLPEPYDTWTEIERVGSRSISLVSEIADDRGEVLSCSRVTLVFVDRTTRRSSELTPELRAALTAGAVDDT